MDNKNLPTGWRITRDAKGNIKYLDEDDVIHDELPEDNIKKLNKEVLRLKEICESNFIHVGVICLFTGNNPPNGWLICNGNAINRIQYANLFQVIGTTYGIGDNTITFNIPDLRGRTVIGSGQGVNLTNRQLCSNGGEETHQLTINEMPSHSHQYHINITEKMEDLTNMIFVNMEIQRHCLGLIQHLKLVDLLIIIICNLF